MRMHNRFSGFLSPFVGYVFEYFNFRVGQFKSIALRRHGFPPCQNLTIVYHIYIVLNQYVLCDKLTFVEHMKSFSIVLDLTEH